MGEGRIVNAAGQQIHWGHRAIQSASADLCCGEGSCCLPDGTCEDDVSFEWCQERRGSYRPYWWFDPELHCNELPCPEENPCSICGSPEETPRFLRVTLSGILIPCDCCNLRTTVEGGECINGVFDLPNVYGCAYRLDGIDCEYKVYTWSAGECSGTRSFHSDRDPVTIFAIYFYSGSPIPGYYFRLSANFTTGARVFHAVHYFGRNLDDVDCRQSLSLPNEEEYTCGSSVGCGKGDGSGTVEPIL